MRTGCLTTNLLWCCLVIAAPLLSSIGSSSRSFERNQDFRFDPGTNWAEEQLAKMTLDEKIGQFFMVAAYSNQGEQHLSEISKMISTDHIGGIIFFQGERKNLVSAVKRFQSEAKVPLLIGMDAEWGTQMRLFGEDRFPYAYTIGAADSVVLSEKIAGMMAQECRELGIHINFTPVADVNSNPKNPVIGFRSFGENPKKVSDHVKAFVRGLEENGVMTSIKHFPGHGNTDKDSHLELPKVSQSIKTLEAIDLYPFVEGIAAGTSSVMVGHLSVPALDPSGTPASLSKKIIREYLQGKMGFKGLVISDALNMKAVSSTFGRSEVALKAFEAGCDILLFPEDVAEAIKLIRQKVESGEITKKEIDERCLKILKAKQKFIPTTGKFKKFSASEVKLAKYQIYEMAATVLRNENNVLPIGRLDKKIARVSVGVHTAHFRDAMDLYAKVDHYHYFSLEEATEEFRKVRDQYDMVIVALHANTVRPKNNFGFGTKAEDFLSEFNPQKENVLVLFGNPLVLENGIKASTFDAVVVAYENHGLAQNRVAQLLFGAIPSVGKLPMTVSDVLPRGSGVYLPWGGRLKYTLPEEIGLDPKKLNEIDSIALNGIKKGAYPGCQIVVAVKGKVVYQRSFGTKEYGTKDTVRNTDLYDIASVSKIAGSTVGVMKLQSEGKFTLSARLNDYLPELTERSPYGNIVIRDMMAHQAGLTAWIPFYKRTMKDGQFRDGIYSETKKDSYSLQVAKDLYILDSYTDTIYKQILTTALGPKNYEYSDLGYYFIKKIVEKQTSMAFDQFLTQELYAPMGLRTICFNPLNYFPPNRIVPTENDQAFRKQQLRGYVHDPGAAMLGGVGGHAGVFSSATDLAALMQMIMNRGMYGNVQFLKAEVVDEYTKAQFTGNRRGAGFDRPKASGGGTCHELASQSSYGHSGFTGTLVWADPETGVNYVFLSNRVCPDQDNWKLRDMNIRTEIQRVIYEAVKSAKVE